MKTIVLIALSGLATNAFSTTRIPIDISGYSSWGFQGDPQNETLRVWIAIESHITQISWDVNLTTVGQSWAEDNTIGFYGNSFAIQIAFGDSFSTSNMNYTGATAANIMPGSTNWLDIEFYETGWDDNPGAIDSYFEEGSIITLHGNPLIPSPSSLAAFGLAGIGLTRRKR